MTQLDHAIAGLEQALDRPRRHQMWRWLVRHRLAAVHDTLANEATRRVDAWLASRQSILIRERDTLLLKLERAAGQIADAPDVEQLGAELRRLVSELHRHRQRVNDLVYDTVALELGGSD